MTAPEDLERLILSMALNWRIDALLIAEAPGAYRMLPAIRERLPGVRTADAIADLDALELTDSTIDALNYRLARSHAAEKRLQGMALDNQQVRWISYGVEVAEGKEAPGEGVAIGFRGGLDRANGADLLPALAGELNRLLPGARISWVIAGTGPLEPRLREAFAGLDATFVGEREPAADLLVVLSEVSSGDWASLEALRRGTPVVAFHTDGREEIVGEACGVLVIGGRDGELRAAKAAADLLRDRRVMEAMGAAARRHAAQRFSTAAEAEHGRIFLEELLDAAEGTIQS